MTNGEVGGTTPKGNGASVPEHDRPDPLFEQLTPFLAANPEAQYQRSPGRSIIETPWGDKTLELRIPRDSAELVGALNQVRLPPRFSAIWHRDSMDLEVVYTTLPVEHDLRSRAFDFAFKGWTFKCEFGDASSRLLAIASAAWPVRPPTGTMHRNMPAFAMYRHYITEHHDVPPPEVPTSFWIRAVEWDDDKIAELSRHLNFFTYFFDRNTPWMLIHDEPPLMPISKSVRYPYGSFPSAIAGKPMDSYLLSVWQSLMDAPDPFRRFLYGYQILEYRAFSYVNDATLQIVKRTLAAPNTPSRLDDAAREILEAVAADKLTDDVARMVQMMRQLINPDSLWTQIEPNTGYFSSEVKFDGGLVMEPLLKSSATLENFRQHWLNTFPHALRRLRNALAHGREVRVKIAPTPSNLERLRPWLGPLMVAAQEALLYGSN